MSARTRVVQTDEGTPSSAESDLITLSPQIAIRDSAQPTGTQGALPTATDAEPVSYHGGSIWVGSGGSAWRGLLGKREGGEGNLRSCHV